MSVDDPVPPEDRLTLVGLREAVRPDGDDTVSVTEPEKPLRLARLIVEVADEPAKKVRLDGLLEILKSAAPTLTVTETRVRRAAKQSP